MIFIILLATTVSCWGAQSPLVERLKAHRGVHLEALSQNNFPITVKRTEKEFSIITEDYEQGVQSCFVDKLIKDMSPRALEAAVQQGHVSLQIEQAADGNPRIVAKGKLRGAGPIAGMIAYGTTKAVCYGAMLGGIFYSIRKGSGVAQQIRDSGPTSHDAAEMLQEMGVTVGLEHAGMAMGQTAPLVGIAISHNENLGQIAHEGVGTIASTGMAGMATVSGAIESTATWVGAVFTAIPWLP